MLQPVLDIDEVTAFLERWPGGAVSGVSQFSNGHISSVFGFEIVDDVDGLLKGADPDAESGKYIMRFVSLDNGEGLKKDRFIAPRAAAVGVLVPRVVKHGEVRLAVANLSDEEKSQYPAESFPLGFAICDWMPGEYMGEHHLEHRRSLIPSAVRTIDLISKIDISDTKWFGWFDGDGNGKYETWRDYVASQAFPYGRDNFYERRRDWFDDGFLEESVFQGITDRMLSTLERIPEVERSVVHMEFGYDNTLVVGDEVSAALDWDNSIIGGHLYDGAWTDLHAPEIDYKQLFVERYAETAEWLRASMIDGSCASCTSYCKCCSGSACRGTKRATTGRRR